MIIVVDFDGTIVEHKYPGIGKEIPFAIDVLKQLRQEKHRLILWSVRESQLLDEAVDFCRGRGLVFDTVNRNLAEGTHRHYPRKLEGDIFVDNSNLGGLPDWKMVYRLIHDKLDYTDICMPENGEKQKSGKGTFRWKKFLFPMGWRSYRHQ